MPAPEREERPPRYRWGALSNSTLGISMAAINSPIVLSSVPAIFRGIHLGLAAPTFHLSAVDDDAYMVVSATRVVTLGRLGDVHGWVRMYNWGFVIWLRRPFFWR